MQCACALLHSHLWPVWMFCIFPHCLINGTIFERKKIVIEHKICVFECIYNFFFSETFPILRRIIEISEMYVGLRLKYRLVLSEFNETWIFSIDFSENTHTWNFMKIRPVGAELLHAEWRKDVTKLIAFRNFATAPNKTEETHSCVSYVQYLWHQILFPVDIVTDGSFSAVWKRDCEVSCVWGGRLGHYWRWANLLWLDPTMPHICLPSLNRTAHLGVWFWYPPALPQCRWFTQFCIEIPAACISLEFRHKSVVVLVLMSLFTVLWMPGIHPREV